MTSPNGGKSWVIGSSQVINWTSVGVTERLKIELSRDGGTNWEFIDNNVDNNCSYAWKIADSVTGHARIKITSISEPNIHDTTDTDFIISAPKASSNVTPLVGAIVQVTLANGTPVAQCTTDSNGSFSFYYVRGNGPAGNLIFNFYITLPSGKPGTTSVEVNLSDGLNYQFVLWWLPPTPPPTCPQCKAQGRGSFAISGENAN